MKNTDLDRKELHVLLDRLFDYGNERMIGIIRETILGMLRMLAEGQTSRPFIVSRPEEP